MGYSKNRQIKRQARQDACVKYKYFTCPQVKGLYTVGQRVCTKLCSPGSMARKRKRES